MLYSYSGFPEKGWSLIEKNAPRDPEPLVSAAGLEDSDGTRHDAVHQELDSPNLANTPLEPNFLISSGRQIPGPCTDADLAVSQPHIIKKQHVMSSLSIILTLISILVRTILHLFGSWYRQLIPKTDL